MHILKRLRGSGTIQASVLTIALVPSVAILLVGAALSGYLVSYGLQVSDFADKLSSTSGPATRFVTLVQDERRLSLAWLNDRRQDRAPLDHARSATDAAVPEMDSTVQNLADGAPADVVTNISKLRAQMAQLRDTRDDADTGRSDSHAVYESYNRMMDTFAESMRAVARSSPEAAVAYELTVAVDLLQSAEAMSRGHSLAAAQITEGLTEQQFHEYIHQIGAYHEDLDSLVPRMTPQERDHYKKINSSPTWKQLTAVQNALQASGAEGNRGPGTRLPITVPMWESLTQDLAGQLDTLSREHSDYAAELGAESASTTLTTSLVGGGVILAIAGGVFIVALRLSRKLIRRLTRLRQETLALAERDLPSVVQRLRAGERVNVETEVPWLNHGDDEIGQVASAFNMAQRTAVSATVQESETRHGVRSVFLNIAHRSQVMVHRQLQVLDKAERSQEDPDQLELLFQLDHLATQSRRNAENLIILGGERPGRQWRKPVSLLEIVRSAVAETEHYARVNTGALPEVALEGTVVADLIHLLAELVDNATSFSPPESHVEVHGNVVGKGAVIEIEDQGLGIEAEKLDEINAMLHTPPDFGMMALSGESKMGLFVVAQLAMRHEIKITLRDSAYGGIRALVLIPSTVIAQPDSADSKVDTSSQPRRTRKAESIRRMSGDIGTEISNAPAAPSEAKIASNPPEIKERPQPRSVSQTPSPIPRSTMDEPRSAPRVNPRVRDLPPARHEAPTNTPSSTAGHTEPVQGNGADRSANAAARNGSGNGQGNKPPLPRRKRQANLAAQLRDDAAAERPEPVQKSSANNGTTPHTAEQSRARMAAFQQGTRQGRGNNDDAHPGSAGPKGNEA